MLTILCYSTYKAVTLPKKISKRSSSTGSNANLNNSSNQKIKEESEKIQEKEHPKKNQKEKQTHSILNTKEENKENDQNADQLKKKENEEKKRREKEEAELKKKLELDKKKLDEYEITEELLASGVKMEVRKAIYKKNKEARVVKIYRKKDLTPEEMRQIQNEIKALSKLNLSKGSSPSFPILKRSLKIIDHPNIVKDYDVFEDEGRLYIFMEYCSGGELLDVVEKQGNISEQLASDIIRQILQGVQYCHSQGLIHKDLKPDNILLLNPTLPSPVKIIDFGSSLPPSSSQSSLSYNSYLPPEAFKGKLSEKSDIWGIGMILHFLISGTLPKGVNEEEKQEDVELREGFEGVSEGCTNLIKNLLKKNPEERPTAEKALNNEWIKEGANKKLSYTTLLNSSEKLKKTREESKLKESIISLFYKYLNSNEQKESLKKMFAAFDASDDGIINKKEFLHAMQKIYGHTINEKEIEKIFKLCDKNKNGRISYSEFSIVMVDREALINRDKVEELFRILDKDNSGFITLNELTEIITKSPGGKSIEDQWAKMIENVDKNLDGKISMNEFRRIFFNQQVKPAEQKPNK